MRADPACRFPEHRSTDWALEHDLTWQCGICQAPSRAVVKVGMAVYRDNDIGATVPGEGLSPAEADRLGELEQVVARGLRTFVEVGNALAEIRDQRLYRVGHRTFEDYCRERWDLSRPYAYNLIDAAAVSAIADTAGLPVPASEAVARALVPLKRDPARVRAAWADTVAEHGPTPTARQVRARVKGGDETRGKGRDYEEIVARIVALAEELAERLHELASRDLTEEQRDELARAIDTLLLISNGVRDA